MSEVHDLQKRVLGLQNSENINTIVGQIISGKKNYKTVIEMKKEPSKCRNCDKFLEGNEKFCPECGTKVENNEQSN